jgi:hypothetical protein
VMRSRRRRQDGRSSRCLAATPPPPAARNITEPKIGSRNSVAFLKFELVEPGCLERFQVLNLQISPNLCSNLILLLFASFWSFCMGLSSQN